MSAIFEAETAHDVYFNGILVSAFRAPSGREYVELLDKDGDSVEIDHGRPLDTLIEHLIAAREALKPKEAVS